MDILFRYLNSSDKAHADRHWFSTLNWEDFERSWGVEGTASVRSFQELRLSALDYLIDIISDHKPGI